VNLLDLLLVVALVGAGWAGWQLGLVRRGLSWLGMILGLLVTLRLLPEVLEELDGAGDDWMLIAGLALLVGGAFCGQAIGLAVSSRVQPAVPEWAVGIDRAGGAALGVVGVIVFAWIALPAVGAASSWPHDQYGDSRLVAALDAALPEPPESADAFRRLVGDELLPSPFVPDDTPAVGEPPAEIPLDPATVARVTPSIVRVEARACGRVQDGSGFVIGPDLVVTNAHVVAGSGDKLVVDSEGVSHDATVVTFDPRRDLALLSVPGFGAALLELATPERDGVGAAFGYPGGGDLRLAPFRVGPTVQATGHDLYDREETRRRVIFVATDLDAGDSGAALVDTDGNVIGIAFAVAPGDGDVAFALHADELRAFMEDADTSREVSTQECV
jgi:S1-C subfamily serine protease